MNIMTLIKRTHGFVWLSILAERSKSRSDPTTSLEADENDGAWYGLSLAGKGLPDMKTPDWLCADLRHG